MFFFFNHGLFPQSEVIIYQSDNENITAHVLFKDETFWMPQKDIATLFGVGIPAISKHLSNIFQEGELSESSVISKMETTASDGKNYLVTFYNLDAIIAVGYRINSKKATSFRIWATKVLSEYTVKGFALNDDLLKNGKQFGKDYFEELLERIREIRASERRFYQKLTDIFAQCSFDYDKDSIEAKSFYATVQNKLHWAVTKQTAAEIIHSRVDHKKPHMGLTTWKNAPNGKVLQSDVTIAKNYLSETELDELNRIVTMFLDFAELRAQRQQLMSMDDWAYRLDSFLQFNEYDILHHLGKISKAVADKLAVKEFKQYRIIQDKEYISDFDKLTKDLK